MPVVAHGIEVRLRREQTVIVGMRGEPVDVGVGGDIGTPRPKFQITEPQPEPRHLFARQIGAAARFVERHVQQMARFCRAPLDLLPPCQPRGNRQFALVRPQAVEGATRVVVAPRFELDLGQRRAVRQMGGVGLHESALHLEGVGEAMLGEQRRCQHLRRRCVVHRAIAQ